MKPIYFFLSYFLLLASCATALKTEAGNAKSPGRYTAQLDPGEEEIQSAYQYMVSRRTDGTYVMRTFFPETYKMTSLETFSDSSMRQAEGPYRFYSDEGKLRTEGQFVANERTGSWKSYRPETGEMEESGAYVAGKKAGEWTSFDSLGRKEVVASYLAGDLVQQITYDSTGAIISHFRYADGEIVEVLVGEKPALKQQKLPLFVGCGAYTEETYEEVKQCADRKMLEFIYQRVKYPVRAAEYGVEGTGIVRFVIEKDGSVNDIKVVRGLSQDISAEMVRLVRLMPNWIPGTVDGETQRVKFSLPVKFKLK